MTNHEELERIIEEILLQKLGEPISDNPPKHLEFTDVHNATRIKIVAEECISAILMNEKDRNELREIIEKLWIDCNNIPDDGTIYDPIGILQDQAITAILNAGYIKKDKIEIDVKDIAELIYMDRDYFIGKIIRIKDSKEVSLEEYASALASKIKEWIS